MAEIKDIIRFYNGKKVLITGHTGFKGAWLCETLLLMGASIIGYALPPETVSLFRQLNLNERMISIEGDIRDLAHLEKVFLVYHPEVVFHLAAQPLVLRSYEEPVLTYETNVLGTVNVCECIRLCHSVKSFVNITTDKVYENADISDHAFSENEPLDGGDPYSNSKSCSELITSCFRRSFLSGAGVSVTTARAGNVIGGGDYADNRIIPDFIRSFRSGTPLVLRHPRSIRPFQHVLEAIYGYLFLAMAQTKSKDISGAYNIGPDQDDVCTVLELVNHLNRCLDNSVVIEIHESSEMGEEANYLRLNNEKFKKIVKAFPMMRLHEAITWTGEWYKCWSLGQNLIQLTDDQIRLYFGL